MIINGYCITINNMAGLMIGNEVRGIGAGACGVVSGVNDIGIGLGRVFGGVIIVVASSMQFVGHTFGLVSIIAETVSVSCIDVANRLGVEDSAKTINIDDYDDCDIPN